MLWFGPLGPLVARLLCYAAILLVAFLAGWLTRDQQATLEMLADEAGRAKAAQIELQRQQAVADKVVTELQAKLRTRAAVHENNKPKVAFYVPPQIDSGCSVNNGFVWMLEAARRGVPLPANPPGLSSPAAGVTLSAVADTVADNYDRCGAIVDRYNKLLEWVEQMSTQSQEKQ